MPKYIVTGGEDGQAGVNYDGKRYEAGEEVEIAKPKGLWLIDEGYLALASEFKKRARNDKGHYIADDPDTPENEAFETPKSKSPAKKAGGK